MSVSPRFRVRSDPEMGLAKWDPFRVKSDPVVFIVYSMVLLVGVDHYLEVGGGGMQAVWDPACIQSHEHCSTLDAL